MCAMMRVLIISLLAALMTVNSVLGCMRTSKSGINLNNPPEYQSISFASQQLTHKLEKLTFLNKGIVTAQDAFLWQPSPCKYLEAENVTVVRNSWAVTKQFNYLYQRDTTGNLKVPPLGMRSAVPLGGISTGSVELRADGTFHEWIITNQSPASAAKVHFLPELLFGIRTVSQGHTEAMVLQTHPSSSTLDNIPGVQQLDYSGAYPVTRLKVKDDRLPVDATLYAYSTYSVGDMNSSAVPAIAFTFVIKNPSSEAVDVSLMMNLPAGILHQQHRTQHKAPECNGTVAYKGSLQDCVNRCLNNMGSNCLSWSYNTACQLPCQIFTAEEPHIPLNSFKVNATSGLYGQWSTPSQQQCLTFMTPGQEGPSGNISTCLLEHQQQDFSYDITYSVSIHDLWATFRDQGHFNNDPISGSPGVHGALAIKSTIQPGQNMTQTFLLAWNYPYRDFEGVVYGNYYPHIYADTEEVVAHVNSSILQIVDNITALHQTFFNSSIPEFLSDVLINSLSHIRSAMWFSDGRWRQWEAYDCTNLDSVHNDGERHIPYIMFFPDTTRNKMDAWAAGQTKDGMIQEQLRCGCLTLDPGEKIDAPCGRYMSDVSSMFNVYLLELYKWSNDRETLQKLWPNARKAALWHIRETSKYGVPVHMVNTYDMLGQDKFDLCSYNSAFHILALRVSYELAMAMGDKVLPDQIQAALQKAYIAMDMLQWNETRGYYNSYTNMSAPTVPGALMTDTFYAQVLAYSLGLGELIPNKTRLLSHMKQELLINDTPYGMLVQTGRHPYPGPAVDGNAVWMMGNPNWATVNIHLKQNVTHALSVANKTLNRLRQEVNDLWNVAGVMGGIGYGAEGNPWDTSHYGYFMSSWHLILALSGQQMDGNELIFNSPPGTSGNWSYPVLLPGILGKISQATPDNIAHCPTFCFSIHVGKLVLYRLAVNGYQYDAEYPLVLTSGDHKCWCPCYQNRSFWGSRKL